MTVLLVLDVHMYTITRCDKQTTIKSNMCYSNLHVTHSRTSHTLMGSFHGVPDFFSPSAAENGILMGQAQ